MSELKTYLNLLGQSFNPLAPPNPQNYSYWLELQKERTLNALTQYKEINAQIIREGLLSRKVILESGWVVNDRGNYVKG